MLVYLGGPIDGVTISDARGWRSIVVESFNNESGVIFYNPLHAFIAPKSMQLKSDANKMQEINREAMDYSDLVVINLSGPGRAIGSIRELEYAICRQIPTVVVYDTASLFPYALHDVEVVPDIGSLVGYIEEMAKNECD